MSSILTPSSTSPTTAALEHSTPAGRQWQQLLPGLALTGLIALLAITLGNIDVLQANGISALTLAIVLGILAGNTVYPRIAATSAAGVQFSKANLLRMGIILYGLRLTFQDIAHVGWSGAVIDALVLGSTFGLAYVLGTRIFRLDRQTALLIGAGSSICGAAAVMATEPVVRARAEQVTVAVATVVVFGTLAIFLYPALYHLNTDYQLIAMTPSSYGVFAGSTIHEVAQVVAAGRAVSEQAANSAVIAKMVRVMMLAPFLLILSLWLARRPTAPAAGQRMRITIPWFALCFIAVAGLNSLAVLPPVIVQSLTTLDPVLLAMAMAGLGLGTHVSVIRKAGIKPLALGAVLFAWLLGGGLAINTLVHALLY
jgi:uncharacterized integral membrane protein (TIGR00698 family)